MRPIEGTITTDFFQPRPLSMPEAERDHVHGAIDIAAPVGTPIKMPEDGAVMAWAAFRTAPDQYWPDLPMVDDIPFPWCNYFYDTFGAVLVVTADKNRTHIIAHSYANQLFNKTFDKVIYEEEKEEKRFPLHALYTYRRYARHGELIGYVGNAGYSTGPHVHWEIHHGRHWNRWEQRINPEKWV